MPATTGAYPSFQQYFFALVRIFKGYAPVVAGIPFLTIPPFDMQAASALSMFFSISHVPQVLDTSSGCVQKNCTKHHSMVDLDIRHHHDSNFHMIKGILTEYRQKLSKWFGSNQLLDMLVHQHKRH